MINELSVCHVTKIDKKGGAGIAAWRLHTALKKASVKSMIACDIATQNDPDIITANNFFERAITFGRVSFGDLVAKTLISNPGNSQRSLGLIPSIWPNKLNRLDVDIIHLHWIGNEMLSISDICRINKPMVWTFHDMWPFLGTEHYESSSKWEQGYQSSQEENLLSTLFDLDEWIFKTKSRAWEPIQIITPSRWMADNINRSSMMYNWPVTVIRNTIDTKFWKPMNRMTARSDLGLPANKKIIAFSASGGTNDPRKGFDLLTSALQEQKTQNIDLELLVVGHLDKRQASIFSHNIHSMGQINCEYKMRLIYNSVDAVVVPSRQDNLPNICLEAMSCGTPIVGFDIGGLKEIVGHKSTGFLSIPENPKSLAEGIFFALSNLAEDKKDLIRTKAQARYNEHLIANEHINLYSKTIADCKFNH